MTNFYYTPANNLIDTDDKLIDTEGDLGSNRNLSIRTFLYVVVIEDTCDLCTIT